MTVLAVLWGSWTSRRKMVMQVSHEGPPSTAGHPRDSPVTRSI
jgi:hypothetical protein